MYQIFYIFQEKIMKKISLTFSIIFILFVFLSGCSSDKGISMDDLIIEAVDNKSIHYLDGKPYTGRVYKFAEDNENLLLEFNLLEGLFHERYSEYNINGSLVHDMFYKNGVLNGLEEKYYENGQLYESVNYLNGNFHGKRMVYWSNGILKEQNHFSNGILGGENLFYYSNGKLRKRLKFDSKGRKDGVWEDFFPDGNLKERVVYKNGNILESTNSNEN